MLITLSIISRIKAKQAVATTAPWLSANTLPNGAVEIGRFTADPDAALSLEMRNGATALITLYDVIKAYQPRMAAVKAPLAAQRKAIASALAALDVA